LSIHHYSLEENNARQSWNVLIYNTTNILRMKPSGLKTLRSLNTLLYRWRQDTDIRNYTSSNSCSFTSRVCL